MLLLLLVLACLLTQCWPVSTRFRGGRVAYGSTAGTATRFQRKPAWVERELIKLKALAPELGCRSVAEVFNRRFAKRRVSVGKSYVADLLRRRRLDVLRMRRQLKHRVPRSTPINRIWGLDLTGKADLSGQQRMILGLLDHGSRASLKLVELRDKSSLSILRELIDGFCRFGLPSVLRTDNEACFTSWTMRAALVLLGIRHQPIEPHCPWQNGRIERFFGTLKAQLDRIGIADGSDLRRKLIEFRCWYQHRPHQHLAGLTPAEVWEGRGRSTRMPLQIEAWEGRLMGWCFPP